MNGNLAYARDGYQEELWEELVDGKYERCGVREYWMIHPAEMSIEQYVLENGKFVLRDIFYHYPDYVVDDMDEEERQGLVTEFPCTLFPDCMIRLKEVFAWVTPF